MAEDYMRRIAYERAKFSAVHLCRTYGALFFFNPYPALAPQRAMRASSTVPGYYQAVPSGTDSRKYWQDRPGCRNY